MDLSNLVPNVHMSIISSSVWFILLMSVISWTVLTYFILGLIKLELKILELFSEKFLIGYPVSFVAKASAGTKKL